MDDKVHSHIEQLVSEEHRLWDLEAAGHASETDREKLASVKVDLDRYWDLLRRRRAARSVGEDADDLELRPDKTVEHYLQ